MTSAQLAQPADTSHSPHLLPSRIANSLPDGAYQLLDAMPNAAFVLNCFQQIVATNSEFDTFVRANSTNAHTLWHGLLDNIEWKLPAQGLDSTRKYGISRMTLDEFHQLVIEISMSTVKLAGETYTLVTLNDLSASERHQKLDEIFYHDLKNTLSTLLGITRGLTSELLPWNTEYLEAIDRQAMQLVNEIEIQQALQAPSDLMLMGRIETIQTLDLLNDIVDDVSLSYASRHVITSPEAEDIVMTTQPALLRRVIENMVKNALEASEPGDTITLDCQLVEDRIIFSVHNPYVIPQEIQARLFTRWFSTKQDGRGLGTYSMKLLTERYLGGTLTFESSPEIGTIFRAAYPIDCV